MSRLHISADGDDLAAAIDRLVTGELAAADRRALLLALEASPDGWRQCALAFLEDQAWRTAIARPSEQRERPVAPPQLAAPAGPQPRARLGRRHALAAAVFAAGCGLAFQAGTRSMVADPPADLASPSSTPGPMIARAPTAPGQPIGWVDLVDPADADAQPQPVPILAATDANEQWLREQPAAIPAYVRAQWERRGFVVEENRHLVDLGLRDGNPVAIPVDEVAVDYVGRQPL